jgi:ubiquinone/menaquinone biosynthesis C-methylase UbiE
MPATKVEDAGPTGALQDDNARWWEQNPMVYDNFRGEPAPATREEFERVDRRFFSRYASWFAQAPGDPPFSALIPFERLRGLRVLEIGCGSGAHARLLAQSGADLSCVDITHAGVEMTRRRLALYGLSADVRQMDAERLEFPDASFDFVWSWGVIHHSADTAAVVREIARVLRPGGEARLMVYHRRSFLAAYATVAGVLTGRAFSMSRDQLLHSWVDGAVARFYTQPEFAALLAPHFGQVNTEALGQVNELIPLPGYGPLAEMKIRATRLIPRRVFEPLLRRWGYFLWARAVK